jgi:hypothetical protein
MNNITEIRGDKDRSIQRRFGTRNNLRINFTAYPEKPKESLLPGFRKLCELHTTVRPLLEATMEVRDFALLHN